MTTTALIPNPAEQWWGHNKEHGWIVLDRSLDGNGPGIKRPLFFLRCKDAKTFSLKRENWRPPAYVFAPNYIRGLKEPESSLASETLEGFQSRWPELQEEIRRQFDAASAQQALAPA